MFVEPSQRISLNCLRVSYPLLNAVISLPKRFQLDASTKTPALLKVLAYGSINTELTFFMSSITLSTDAEVRTPLAYLIAFPC